MSYHLPTDEARSKTNGGNESKRKKVPWGTNVIIVSRIKIQNEKSEPGRPLPFQVSPTLKVFTIHASP